VSVAYPDLAGGYLTETAFAGSLFPQPVAADGEHLDTVLGLGAVLISRVATGLEEPGIRVLDLGTPALAKFSAPLGAWLATADATAVLIRPDRHVFGTGDPRKLLDAWRDPAIRKLAA
jgi:3-(3-hydroxy-phenyl)propionate hydroxylase